MSCLFNSGYFLLSNGYGAQALQAARELNDLADRAEIKLWIRKAGTLSGLVNADLGNVADAMIEYSNSLSLAREMDDAHGEASVCNNLGMALNLGGLYREAIPCLEKAVSLSRTKEFATSGVKGNLASIDIELPALANLAQSHLYLEQFHQGFAAISECLSRSLDPHDASTATGRVIREFTYVQLALELGKYDLAREHRELCTKYGKTSWKKGQQCMEISRGLCEVYCGDADLGVAILEALLTSDYDINSGRVTSLNALVKAYSLVGRPEKALECLEQLLAQIRSAREHGVSALLSVARQGKSEPIFALESDDLRSLRFKEAQLRAKVAENSAIGTRVEMLERLAITADMKEEASGEHGYRVGKLSSLVAEKLNWSRDECVALELAARVHDIGKIGIPDQILLSSKELDGAERHFMGTHTVIGAELLAKSSVPQLRMAEEIARFHHEWWNGAGYPSKLSGKRIPIHARIVALCDVFDALTHGRPYSAPWPIERAVEEIRNRRGTQFDPELTDCFLALVERLQAEHSDLDAFLGKASRNSPFLQARNKIRVMLAEERRGHGQKATVAGSETRH